MAEPVRVETRGPVLLVTLCRAEKRNAVNEEMTLLLDQAFDRFDDDSRLRVAVLAAEGGFFCAGTDLRTGAGPHTERGGMYGVIRRRRLKPLVAAVNGPALGGGFELVLAADLVVAAPSAWFSLPETTRGRVPAAGGLFRAPDRLPRNVAVELMLTAGRLPAERAHQLGLVNRLAEDVRPAALELALATCGSAPEATAELFTGLHALSAEADQVGWRTTHHAMTTLLTSDDRTEGNAAFLERRRPRWVPADVVRNEVLG